MKLNTDYWGKGYPYLNFDDGNVLTIGRNADTIATRYPNHLKLNEEFDQSILIGTNFKNPHFFRSDSTTNDPKRLFTIPTK